MEYSFVIRRALIEDAPDIQKIIKNAFTKYVQNSDIKEIPALDESIADIAKDIKNNYVFIALIDNIPVGTVRVKIDYNKEQAKLYRFGVNTDYHNIGIGKSLMNLVDKLLLSKNINKVYLYTDSKYHALVRFYYSRGFYIHSTSFDKGYIRALMIKEYLINNIKV